MPYIQDFVLTLILNLWSYNHFYKKVIKLTWINNKDINLNSKKKYRWMLLLLVVIVRYKVMLKLIIDKKLLNKSWKISIVKLNYC